jgi:hypothetical protein
VPIPSHQQWMADTGLGIMKPRSQALKDVDSAIEASGRLRTQASLFKIRTAFEAWKRYNGVAWATSERNTRQALTTLERELATAGADLRSYQLSGNRDTGSNLHDIFS